MLRACHSKGWTWWSAGLVLLLALAFTLLTGSPVEAKKAEFCRFAFSTEAPPAKPGYHYPLMYYCPESYDAIFGPVTLREGESIDLYVNLVGLGFPVCPDNPSNPDDKFNFCPEKSYTIFMKFRGDNKPLNKWMKQHLKKRGISITRGFHHEGGGLTQKYTFTPEMVKNRDVQYRFTISYPQDNKDHKDRTFQLIYKVNNTWKGPIFTIILDDDDN